MRIDRMLAITVMLLHKRKVSARELADKFEVSVRTVYRDIEAINMAGIPVVAFPGNNGGFGIMDNYKIDRRLLSLKDITSILTALKGINLTFQDKEVDTAIDKISSLIPLDKTVQVEQELDNIVIDFMPWGYGARHKELLKIIQCALAERKLIRFIYENARYEILERTVEPMTLIFKGFAWYLFGFCRAKNDFRLFRISRIKELATLNEEFERRNASYSEFSADKKEQENWIQVKLKFSASIKSRVEEYFENYISERYPNGETLVDVAFPKDDWIYSTLLSFGEHVEVIEPSYIKETLKNKAEKILSLYKHDTMLSQ